MTYLKIDIYKVFFAKPAVDLMAGTAIMSSKEIISSIHELYDRFRIPENLQMHMIMAASAAELICAAWNGPAIQKDDIVAVLLIHDLGNIVKFHLESEEGVSYLFPDDRKKIDFWREVKADVVSKYGTNDNKVTIKMTKELGIAPKLQSLLEELNTVEGAGVYTYSQDNWALKICLYTDWRTAPQGIISVKESLDDLLIRYKHNKSTTTRVTRIFPTMIELENQIFENVSLKPEQIDNEAIEPYVLRFKGK